MYAHTRTHTHIHTRALWLCLSNNLAAVSLSAYSQVDVCVCLIKVNWAGEGLLSFSSHYKGLMWVGLEKEWPGIVLPSGYRSLCLYCINWKLSTCFFSHFSGGLDISSLWQESAWPCSLLITESGDTPPVFSLAVSSSCHKLGQPTCLMWGLTVFMNDSEPGICTKEGIASLNRSFLHLRVENFMICIWTPSS